MEATIISIWKLVNRRSEAGLSSAAGIEIKEVQPVLEKTERAGRI